MTHLSLNAPMTAPWHWMLPVMAAVALALTAMDTPSLEDATMHDQQSFETEAPQDTAHRRMVEDWRGNSASFRYID